MKWDLTYSDKGLGLQSSCGGKDYLKLGTEI